jgi:hypothetical protein
MNQWRSGIALSIKDGVSGSSQAMTWVGAMELFLEENFALAQVHRCAHQRDCDGH